MENNTGMSLHLANETQNIQKTPEQYKEEFLKRASLGFLMKIRKQRFMVPDYDFDRTLLFVEAKDEVWSKEAGVAKYHTWEESEFKKILESRGHLKRKIDGKRKRQLFAKKYKHGRGSHKK